MDDKQIAQALGLKPLQEILDAEVEDLSEEAESSTVIEAAVIPYEGSEHLPAVPEPDRELLDDIDTAKTNIYKLIEIGNEGLEEILSVAKQGQSPAAFESMSLMMKQLILANRELVNISKEKKYEKTEQPSQHTTNVTNQNLILSSAELLRMLKGDDT